MSLFKIREWWSITGEDNKEEIDLGCIAIGNITNDSTNSNKIVIGGFSGNLNIYEPKTEDEDGSIVNGFKAHHVIIEATLDSPILQVAIGKFCSGSNDLYLCLLHKDHLVVYGVKLISGKTDEGNQPNLSKIYQHNFHRNAYMLITGNFGSVKGRDFIAVQSLDGCVSIFEQESRGFTSFLPNFLLPGPFAYLPLSDTVVVYSSDWSLQSYKYENLAVLHRDSKENDDKIGGKKMQPDWTQILSEAAIDIQVIVETGNVSSVVVLTTHTFLCYKDSGTLKFIKKLEYQPACFLAYSSDRAIHVCVASYTNNLLVYRESVLKWATQLTFTPVVMRKADFLGIKGSIVLASENGSIQVSYLGTDPSLFVAPPIESKDINYEDTDKELAALHAIIRSSTKDTDSVLKLSGNDKDLVITASVSEIGEWNGVTNIDENVPAVSIIITLSANSPVQSVRLDMNIVKPLQLSKKTFYFKNLYDASHCVVKAYMEEPFIPACLTMIITVSYLTPNGAPRVNRLTTNLPLKLVMVSDVASKDTENKITIATNKPAVNLTELFSDFGFDSTANSAVGFAVYGGNNVTILSSRTSNRYRLQSDSLPSLWLLFDEFLRRLKNYCKHDDAKLVISISTPPPVHELFLEVEAHYLRRKKRNELLKQLEQRATQFRAVQRRLLTKYKDKTLTPLTNLDNLMEGTYKQILQITDALNLNMKGLERDACQLSCVVQLILDIITIQSGMDDAERNLLHTTITPIVYSKMEQGWEEIVDCTVTFVLRSILSKGSKENFMPTDLIIPTDTSRIKKHIGVLIDRILKGELSQFHKAELAIGKEASDEFEVPIGSKLGEDRAKSARIRSAKKEISKPVVIHTDDLKRREEIPSHNIMEREENLPQESLIIEENVSEVTKSNNSAKLMEENVETPNTDNDIFNETW